MRNCLSSVLPIVNHKPVSLLQPLFLGNLGSSNQHLPQYSLVPFFCIGDPNQSILLFGYDEDVGGCDWGNISKGEYVIILIDNVAGNFFSDEFVKDGLLCHCA